MDTESLTWARLTMVLENVRNTHGREHPLFVMRALVKHGWGLAERPLAEPAGWTFHPAGPLASRVRQGGRYMVHVVLPPGPDRAATAAALGENLRSYLGDGSGGRNWRLAGEMAVSPVRLEDLGRDDDPAAEPVPDGSGSAPMVEWALDFLTPLALRAGVEQSLSRGGLGDLLANRLGPLGFTGEVEAARRALTAVEVRPWFMERVRWGHSEKHGPQRTASREDLGGLLGPLYLRGPADAMTALLPALRLAEEFHLGKGLHRAQGAFRLVPERTFFDPRIASHTVYYAAFDAVRLESEADPVLHAPASLTELATATVHSLHEREPWCRALAEEMRASRYCPAPPRMVSIQKKDGGTRTLSLLHDRDRVAQRALLQVVSPVLDRQLENASHAWRAGRGVETARKLVAQAFRDGLTWVVESDIASFYDEIPHDRMDAALRRALPLSDERTFAALRACYAGRESLSSAEPSQSHGLLQGSPLSPLLANLYLDTFDEHMEARGHRMVRYGDDFLLLCPTREAAEAALADCAAALDALGLRLKQEKTALTSFHAGFFFLGREFGGGMDEDAAEAATLRRTLFIHTQGAWAGQDHDSIVVRKDNGLIARVPLERVSDVVFLGAQGVSTWLLQSCARRRVPVTLATARGWHVQTLVPDSRAQWELAARQAARHAALGTAGLLAQARLVVEAKLTNHLAWLRSLPGGVKADAARTAAAEALHRGLQRLHSAPTVESLRGMEGRAAAVLYPVVNGLCLQPEFRSPLRRAREKADLWNTLYDATSSLLFSRLNLLLRSRGINPYLGFLHSAADHYESLVCDLQEPFRARLDRFLVKLVNKRVLTPQHFEPDNPASTSRSTRKKPPDSLPPDTTTPAPATPSNPTRWALTTEGYRSLIAAWDRELRVRLAGDPATLGDLLASQVWLTTEYIQKHLPFLQFYRAALADKDPQPH